MKKKVFLILFIVIGVMTIAAGLFTKIQTSEKDLTEKEEELIRSLVIKDITNYENAQGAKIDLGEIKIEDSKASVEVMLKWNEPGLCVGYHYELIKVSGRWEIKIRERTIVC